MRTGTANPPDRMDATSLDLPGRRWPGDSATNLLHFREPRWRAVGVPPEVIGGIETWVSFSLQLTARNK